MSVPVFSFHRELRVISTRNQPAVNGAPVGRYFFVCALFILSGGYSTSSYAQQSFKVGGLAYFDYYYLFSSPISDDEGDNGFTYRRLYITTDYRISDAFSTRARLEANDKTVIDDGPMPFVKDLYLRWSSESGHDVIFGVTSPPAFDFSEEYWGYRSLEKTILDLYGVVSSRDMGIRVEGPVLPGKLLNYAVMIGNNNGVKPENDRHKRFYAQLRFNPEGRIVGSAGFDYAEYSGETEYGITWNGFLGLVNRSYRVGVEGFAHRRGLDGGTEDDRGGVTVFSAVSLAKSWEIVGRFDRVWDEDVGPDLSSTLYILGIAFQPHDQVRFIPNVEVSKYDTENAATASARFTLEMHF